MSAEEVEVLKERAAAFLRSAKRLFDEGGYDLAAFSVQQFCQLLVKHKLLAKTGTYPRAHSLVRLLRDLDAASGGKGLLAFIDREILRLTKVDDAYIVARYIPRRYEKLEAQELLTSQRVFERRWSVSEQYIRSGKEALDHLRNYREIARRVKEIAKQRYRDAAVYVFGSAVDGTFTASSDIDLLIVSDSIGREQSSLLKAEIRRRVGYSVPLQIHIATTRELKDWYLRFATNLQQL